MSEIYIHRYSLQSKKKLNYKAQSSERNGVLFRTAGGYADLFPWKEFGDPDIEQQLHSIKNGRPLDIARQTLWLAKQDGEFRRQKSNPILESKPLRNHFFVLDLHAPVPFGFKSAKVKLGLDWIQEIEDLNRFAEKNAPLKIRIDFNSLLNLASFESFYQKCSDDLKKQIEFVEDPMPYSQPDWSRANQLLPLACDFEIEKVDWKTNDSLPFQVLVLKPARQSVAEYAPLAKAFDLSLVVTSYLDHPVGSMQALTQALELTKDPDLKVLDAGCLSWTIYSEKIFSDQIKTEGPFILGSTGLGVGFEQILENLAWQKL